MTIENWLFFVGTTLAFMSTPGPSHLLMLSNSASNGLAKSLFTALGDLTANLIQMVAAALGLAGLVLQNSDFFIAIKWAGVLYLATLGGWLIFSKAKKLTIEGHLTRSRSSLFWQGFMTSMSNPKAILFFAALFPQFIDPTHSMGAQFAILSISYLFIDGVFLVIYGKFAEYIVTQYVDKVGAMLNPISGTLYILAAVVLSLKSIRLGA